MLVYVYVCAHTCVHIRVCKCICTTTYKCVYATKLLFWYSLIDLTNADGNVVIATLRTLRIIYQYDDAPDSVLFEVTMNYHQRLSHGHFHEHPDCSVRTQRSLNSWSICCGSHPSAPAVLLVSLAVYAKYVYSVWPNFCNLYIGFYRKTLEYFFKMLFWVHSIYG